MASVYADDGSWRVTIVDGTTYSGRYSSDESIYITPSTTTPDDVEGMDHPCGALIFTTAPDNANISRYAANGSLYVQASPYTSTGAQRVTVVGNGLPPSPTPTQVMAPARITNSSHFYPTIVTPGSKPIIAPRITNTQTFYAPGLSGGVAFVNPPKLTNTNTFYGPTIDALPPALTYVADAVHFNGVTQIFRTSLACPNSEVFAYSVWVKIASTEPGQGVIWSSDPSTNGSCWAQFLNPNKYLTTYWKDELTAKKNPAVTATNATSLYDGAWHHILFCGHSDQSNVNRNQRALYIDDVKVDPLTTTSVGHGIFNLILNTQPFYVGSDGPDNNFFVGDMADFWFTVDNDLISSGPPGGGDIAEATRRLFIDAFGRPADPSGFPPGCILFSGDSTTFHNNQGSGGTFTVISGALTNATTSPSD